MLGKTVRVPRHSELSEPGWRRTGPPHVCFFAKAYLAVVGTGGTWVLNFTKMLKSASPKCILLCATTKMQLFLRGEHRRPSFCGGGAVGAFLQGEQNHA